MPNFQSDYMQNMMNMPNNNYPMQDMANMQNNNNPMSVMPTMPQDQLEAMYPKTYYIIQPAIEGMCDKMVSAYGQMHSPTREQLDAMIDDVYTKVAVDVDVTIKQMQRRDERQFYGSGRRLLKDFIGALLIDSLIRRRPHYHNYPGYYGGGYGGYGGYGGGYGGYPTY